MKRRVLLTIGLALLLPMITKAQPSLPDRSMGIPKVFQNETESWRWARIAESRNWGELSSSKWQVWIDRSGVKALSSPSASATACGGELEFLSKYHVAKEENGYLLLYTPSETQSGLSIPRRSKAVGWVSVDHLLLWSYCPRTQGQIYEKAVILRNYDELQSSQLATISPDFSKHPFRSQPNGWKAQDLEYYFVYKRDQGNVLLFTEYKLPTNTTDISNDKSGWMKKGMYTAWNNRTCYEPNFDADVKGSHAAAFRSFDDARQYKNTGSLEHAIFDETLTGVRWSPNKVRFPVIDEESKIATIGTIGKLGNAKDASKTYDEIERLKEKINRIKAKLSKINVVFVMDGTHSMVNYYKPMAMALQNAMKQDGMSDGNMNFGAVVYRNYADGSRLVEFLPLTTNHQTVANWLAGRECQSVGKTDYEAMLYGLNYAIENMTWKSENANFIILVGDAANAPKDQKGLTVDAIAEKMARLGINFVAFQANHPGRAAYDDFPSQINQLMRKELSLLMKRDVKGKDFKLIDQIYQFRSERWPIYTCAFKYQQIDESAKPDELQHLTEKRIKSFKEQANKELKDIEIGTQTGELSPEMENELRKIGLSDADIKLIKERGYVLKVNGYTSLSSNYKQIFRPCVFMSESELQQLIQSFKAVNVSSSDNIRLDLQNALKRLALLYLGQSRNPDEQSIDQIMNAITGLTSIAGKNVLANYNLKDITNPSKVTDSEIIDFVSMIRKDTEHLEKMKANKANRFSPNANKNYYFYILLDDMPLQDHENSPYK